MSEREAFHNAIAADFADDAPRLVFADWLDEHGEPARAEFIRVQCAAESFPHEHAERKRLERRADELLREHREAWLAGVPETAENPTFRRGFLDRVRVSASHLPECLPALARMPAVRLDVWDWDAETARATSRVPELASVRRFSLTPSTRREFAAGVALSILLKSPFLGSLTELDLSAMTQDGSALVSWPGLANLCRLGLNARMGSDRLRELLQSLTSGSLRSLMIQTPPDLAAEVVRELVSWPGFARLRQLAISEATAAALQLLAQPGSPIELADVIVYGRELSSEVCLRLWRNPKLSRLRDVRIHSLSYGFQAHIDSSPVLAGPESRHRSLSLFCVPLDESQVKALCESSALAGVSVLRLRSCGLTPESVNTLAASPRLSGVRTLDLGLNQLNAKSLRFLAGSPHLQELVILGLENISPNASGMHALAKAVWTRTVEELCLSRCQLNNNTVRALASIPFERLRILRLEGGRGDDERFSRLTEAHWFARLEELHLSHTGINDTALARLRAAFGDRLHTLNIANNPITPDGLRVLFAQPLPGLTCLRVGRHGLSVFEAQEVARWPGLANLLELRFSNGFAPPESLAILARSPHWSRRTTLWLRRNGIQDADIQPLRERVRIVWES